MRSRNQINAVFDDETAAAIRRLATEAGLTPSTTVRRLTEQSLQSAPDIRPALHRAWEVVRAHLDRVMSATQ